MLPDECRANFLAMFLSGCVNGTGSPQLSDMKQTLQDANVSNSMLVMRWVA